MTFSDLLDEYLELREQGPDERNGYTDKAYWNRMQELRNAMNELTTPKEEL